MNRPKILTTLGPVSLNSEIIKKLSDRGVDYFRINMSHTSIDELKQHIETIRKFSDTPICIDSEGAQVRTGLMTENTVYRDRERVILLPGNAMGESNKMGLWPSDIFSQLKPGDILTVDFDSLLLSVTTVTENQAEAIILNGGSVGTNKAVTLFPPVSLPPLSEKDISAVKIGLEYGIKDFALSFTNSADDVLELRKIVGDDSSIISKIESKNGVNNLESILQVSDAILIDRGDLSREIPFENIPFLQKMIINKAKDFNKDVYVATNLLESMMTNSKPTRAEVNDVMNTLLDGATGLVLAAETAIGEQPVAAVDILRSLILRYTASHSGYDMSGLLEHQNLLLPEMHGIESGLHHRKVNDISLPSKYTEQVETLEIDENTFLDVIQIAQGVYAPLNGFMNLDDLEDVLNDYKLSDGQVWTLPIILQINEEKWRSLKEGMTVSLKFEGSLESQMVLKISELYKIDLESVSKRWFGTKDIQHPGVERLMALGAYVVAGEIKHYNYEKILNSHYFLTPQQTRMIFSIKGWSRIVAFHTRNVPHKAHEYLMKQAMERTNADGLLIQPVVGPKKKGDFVAEAILGAYDIFIESCLPGALLCTFSTYSRYSGPREAVFTALCRKNYGCTHFIVGRDHTGVGDYYKQISNNELFDKLGDIGIEIVYFDKVGYSKSLRKMVEKDGQKQNDDIESISGTKIRDALLNGNTIPNTFIRKNIMDFLKERMDSDKPVFVE